MTHALKFLNLLRCQIVLNADCQGRVQFLDFALSIQDFIELCERLLFIDLIRFHGLVERFHGVLKLPLQVREVRLRLLHLRLDQIPLLVAEPYGLLVLHHEFRREEVFADGVGLRLGMWPGLRLRLWLRLLRARDTDGEK